jgi:gluconate 2-dehydrogenase alpha chain
MGALRPGDGVGGAGLHWAGLHWRVLPEELSLRTRYEERYGRGFILDGMTIQDYGVSYEELVSHYDFAEKVFGTSGWAYRVKGQVSATAIRSKPIGRISFRCRRRRTPIPRRYS